MLGRLQLTWLGVRRPHHWAVAPTPGDNSGWQEDRGTTENTEITERRTEEDPKDLNGRLPRAREESSP